MWRCWGRTMNARETIKFPARGHSVFSQARWMRFHLDKTHDGFGYRLGSGFEPQRCLPSPKFSPRYHAAQRNAARYAELCGRSR